MNICKKIFLILPFAISSVVAQSQVKAPIEAPVYRSQPSAPVYKSIKRSKNQNPTGLGLDLAIGGASFQDLQAPLDSNGEIRVDGTSSKEDSTSHAGLSIAAKLGYKSVHETCDLFTSLGIQRASSSSPIGTAAASYLRYNLSVGALWKVTEGLLIETSSEIRRSSFRNTDNGHYLDAILFRVGASENFESFALGASAAIAPISRFGFLQDSNRGKSGAIEGTKSNLMDFNANISYKPSTDAELYLKASEEIVSAQIENISAYKNFGLNVSQDPDFVQDRQVQLTTLSIELGAVRKF